MPATVWKGQITFGLVSFPVRLTAAARAEAVHFHLLHKKDLSRVKTVWYCAKEDKPVDRSDLVKGFETSKGTYVVVEDEELKQVAPTTATTMEILQFVGRQDVDPVFLESSYYVTPEENAAKPYALFVAALKETNQNAIAKIAMHNREHVVLLRPSENTLLLHTLYYPDELHSSNKSSAHAAKFTAKELQLAKSLISHLSAAFEPEKFEDTYRANVQRLIKEKSKGKKITSIEQPRKAPVIDLMEALKRSLASGSRTSERAGSKKADAGEKPARKTGTRRRAA